MVQHKPTQANIPSVDELISRLTVSNRFDRAEAARLLVNMRQEAAKALPALLSLYNDSYDMVRIQVPRVIIHMDPPAGQAAEILRILLDDESASVRSYAADAQRILAQRMATQPEDKEVGE